MHRGGPRIPSLQARTVIAALVTLPEKDACCPAVHTEALISSLRWVALPVAQVQPLEVFCTVPATDTTARFES
jgi:hypothetical protein